MSLMDTADGVVMSRAYGWASASPARRIHYNLTITGLSVAVALLVGTVELLQLAARGLGLSGGVPGVLTALDLGRLGYGIAALSVLAWAIAAIVWTARRSARRSGAGGASEAEVAAGLGLWRGPDERLDGAE
jgi:high-affinity nickel-transport protein